MGSGITTPATKSTHGESGSLATTRLMTSPNGFWRLETSRCRRTKEEKTRTSSSLDHPDFRDPRAITALSQNSAVKRKAPRPGAELSASHATTGTPTRAGRTSTATAAETTRTRSRPDDHNTDQDS